jgi:N-acyl-L-homoserine lactone synthetase
MNEILRRCTVLPFLFDYLHTKELALLNPKSWDDKNDSYFFALDYKAETTTESMQFSFQVAIGLLQESIKVALRHGAKKLITVSSLGVKRLLCE